MTCEPIIVGDIPFAAEMLSSAKAAYISLLITNLVVTRSDWFTNGSVTKPRQDSV